jgi:hypothetical protein
MDRMVGECFEDNSVKWRDIAKFRYGLIIPTMLIYSLLTFSTWMNKFWFSQTV